MASTRQEKMAGEIRKLAAVFISEQSNRNSMITVTRMEISPDFRNGTVYVTVFPTEKEAQVSEFLNRRKRDLREFIKSKLKTKIVPVLSVQIDEGEKNRQKIDQLLMDSDS